MKNRSIWAWNISALFYKRTYGPLAHQLDEDLFSYLGEDLKGAVVADCGCGPGVVSRKLVGRGAQRVFAIDANPLMLRQLEVVPQIIPIEAKVEEGIFDRLEKEWGQQGLDLILFKRSLYQDRPQAVEVLRSAYRHLNPGGRVVIVHPEGSWRVYAFGDPPRLHRHTPYHLFNRAISLLGVLAGIESYALYTREELLALALEASPEASVELIPSQQRAFNLVSLQRPAREVKNVGGDLPFRPH